MKKNIITLPHKLCLVFCFSILSFLILINNPLNPIHPYALTNDSSVFRYVAMVMRNGGMPYRDVFDHKGPFLYIINYIGLKISKMGGVWSIELVLMIVLCITIYKLARLFVNEKLAIITVIITLFPIKEYFEGGNLTEEYAMPFIAISIYIFIDYFFNLRINKLRLIICGVCFAAVCMLRANMVSAWMVFCIAVLLYEYNNNRKIPWYYLIWFVIGISIIVIPIVIWLYNGRALNDFIYDYFIFNRKYVSGGGIRIRLLTLREWLKSPLLIFSISTMVFLIYKKKNVYFNSVYIAYVFLSVVLNTMSGYSFFHYAMTFVPMFAYPVCAILNYFSEQDSKFFICIFLLSLAVIPWLNSLGSVIVTVSGKKESSEYLSNEEQSIVDYIESNSLENDKIQVIGLSCQLYNYCNRLAATKYPYVTPPFLVDSSLYDDFIMQIRNNYPKIIIMPELFTIIY